MTRDLTSGHPLKIILSFALPVFSGYLFQQFYNVVDTIIVGRFLGVNALAAVGSTGCLNFLIIGFIIGLCAGFSIPVAQQFGAKDEKRMRQFIFNSFVLCAILSVFLTLITVVACPYLLRLLKTPFDVIDDANSYFTVILEGIPVIIFYNILAGIVRSVGDSKTPLYFLVGSAIVNIFLDLFFICILGTGVSGAAWATVISQALAAVLCFFYINRRFEILRLRKEDKVFDLKKMSRLLGNGFPMGLQYSITGIGIIILQASVNSLGAIYVASLATGVKISQFFATPFDALGTTMATYGGQNVGAGKIDRLNKGLFWACITGFIWSFAALVIMYLWSDNLALLFMNRNIASETAALVQKNVRIFLLANSSTYWLLAIVNIVRFLIQGMGFSQIAVVAGILELVGRSVIGLFFVPVFGFAGACCASPLAWILADGFLIPAYFYLKKSLVRTAD